MPGIFHFEIGLGGRKSKYAGTTDTSDSTGDSKEEMEIGWESG